MTQEILALCGIPGSGKTTFAREWCAAHPGYLRVNGDDLRAMMGLYDYTVDGCLLVGNLVHKIAWHLVGVGRSVVLDNTNISDVARMQVYALAGASDVPLRWQYFDVDLHECLCRNALREGTARVPDDVIRAMHAQYLELVR